LALHIISKQQKMDIDTPEPSGFVWSLGSAHKRKKRKVFTQEEDEDEKIEFIRGLNNNEIVGEKEKKQKEPMVIPLQDDFMPEEDIQKPILLRNRPPGVDEVEDEQEKLVIDLQFRPKESTFEDYVQTPVHGYGEALLRGMGWAPGKPIGLHSTKITPVITYVRRPTGLGIGAKVLPPPDLKKKKGWIRKPGESNKPPQQMALPQDKDGKVRHYRTLDEKLVPEKEPFYKGAPVYIKGGEHSGLNARVISKGIGYVIVSLPSETQVQVNLEDLEQISEQEAQERQKANSKKRKRFKDGSNSHNVSSKRKKVKSEPGWVCRDIKVKVRSKKLSGGKYYCKVGWIVEVLPRNKCSVQLINPSVLLEGIKQRDLETVIPKNKEVHVKIVQGTYKGELGHVLDTDYKRDRVHVQLLDSLDIHAFRLDDVAEYKA
jgi:G patch domain/KOW motif-containing protein